uniref:Uncharacterized protein n=1 Tax=Timema poppense TaxID=170557 RepID=A0A7R9DVN7_TIMPO|nr:unnamed protein product [Timema poppensis]
MEEMSGKYLVLRHDRSRGADGQGCPHDFSPVSDRGGKEGKPGVWNADWTSNREAEEIVRWWTRLHLELRAP